MMALGQNNSIFLCQPSQTHLQEGFHILSFVRYAVEVNAGLCRAICAKSPSNSGIDQSASFVVSGSSLQTRAKMGHLHLGNSYFYFGTFPSFLGHFFAILDHSRILCDTDLSHVCIGKKTYCTMFLENIFYELVCISHVNWHVLATFPGGPTVADNCPKITQNGPK